jgi:orotate phosphoribosyltransferase
VQEVVDIVEASGATVVGVTSIIDRGGQLAFDDDYYPLLQMKVQSWDPAECVQCADDIPVDSPGSRRI